MYSHQIFIKLENGNSNIALRRNGLMGSNGGQIAIVSIVSFSPAGYACPIIPCFSIVNTYTGRDKEVSESACVRSEGIKIRCHGGKKGGDTRQKCSRVFCYVWAGETGFQHRVYAYIGLWERDAGRWPRTYMRISQLVHSPPPPRPFFSTIWGQICALSLYSRSSGRESFGIFDD